MKHESQNHIALHARVFVGGQSQALLSKRFLWYRQVIFLHTNPIGEDAYMFFWIGISRQFWFQSFRAKRVMNKARQNKN